MEGYHRSVLLREVVKALGVQQEKWYLDCTLGDGGHSIEVIVRGGRVIGIDVDPQALERVRKRFKDEGIDESRFRLINGNFRDLKNLILRRASLAQDNNTQTDTAGKKFAVAKSNLAGATLDVAGAIFDLGVSSLQLENSERGFSFAKMGPLDMRMDPSLNVMALDLVNTLTRKELYELFSKMGEEKYSWAVAGALVSAREVSPITNTLELAELIKGCIGGRDAKVHPATRIFQALRIAVNDELDALKEGLSSSLDLIEKDGHIIIISFHSLEDRIVKNTFREWQLTGMGEILTKKPIVPTEMEVAKNPRSRSAKMRVFKKT